MKISVTKVTNYQNDMAGVASPDHIISGTHINKGKIRPVLKIIVDI